MSPNSMVGSHAPRGCWCDDHSKGLGVQSCMAELRLVSFFKNFLPLGFHLIIMRS
ncbi:hypothetical protein Hanom_Chr03g00193061 [Helianthus anomalus]